MALLDCDARLANRLEVEATVKRKLLVFEAMTASAACGEISRSTQR